MRIFLRVEFKGDIFFLMGQIGWNGKDWNQVTHFACWMVDLNFPTKHDCRLKASLYLPHPYLWLSHARQIGRAPSSDNRAWANWWGIYYFMGKCIQPRVKEYCKPFGCLVHCGYGIFFYIWLKHSKYYLAQKRMMS